MINTSALPHHHSSKAEYLIQQLNVTNAKKVALFMVVGFIIYHGVIHLRYGTDSCKWLLSDGRFKGDREWQPYGCMMHKYSLTDTRRCFRYLAFWDIQNHFVFIGDDRVRVLYQSFLQHLQPHEDDDDNSSRRNDAVPLANTEEPPASVNRFNQEYYDNKLQLRVNYIYANEVNAPMVEQFQRWQRDEHPPSAIVASCTYAGFYNGNLTTEILQKISMNLTRLVQPLNAIKAKKSKVLWKLQDNIDEDSKHLPDEWKNVLNADIDKYNQAIYDVLGYSNVHIWSSARHIANGLLTEAKNGWKLSRLALQHDTQIMLNMYCNDYMNYNDGSCCSSAEPYTILQIVTYAFFAVCLILSVVMLLRRWIMRIRGHTFYMPLNQQQPSHQHQSAANDEDDTDTQHQSTTNTTTTSTTTSSASAAGSWADLSSPIFSVSALALIMAYFYLCDRTNFFMKENKYYSEFSFWIPLGYVFVLGLFFTEDSKFTKVLHRDQTDELKGWMQLVILIYHMTGADRVLPIYMHIKVLISCYLFLSGYGHFTYMWHTGNAGLTRFLQILFRLNFITIVLCLCMNRPYQFYYYVPLISFWYGMIYFVLALPPHITSHSIDNSNGGPSSSASASLSSASASSSSASSPYQPYAYLVLKCICLMAVVTILYMSEVFFERIFVTRPWKALFVTTDDDIHEWWYRWKLDRYTITYGMIFAAFFHIAQKYGFIDDNSHGNLFSRRVSLTATLIAVAGVGFYTTFSFMCRNRQDCEEIHSYIVFIPIVGYLVLRNISGVLRTRFSAFFAWFGRISLELFICQYHIWLAADRHGVLVLLPGFPNLNIIISSFIFVCVSHEVHRLTQVLLPYAVPNDWRLALRNLVVFLVILIPIGRYDGMI